MSKAFDFNNRQITDIYERERYPVGVDTIAGLLHVHSGKRLQDLHILDAGCGTGQYAKVLKDLGVGKITILDSSQELLDFAKEKLRINDVATLAKLPDLPFKDGTFDAAMFNMVLPHAEAFGKQEGFPVMQETLHNAKRVLRPRGVVLITTILPSIQREAVWYTQFHKGVTDIICSRLPTTEQFLAMFDKCGFQCVSAMNFLSKATPTMIANYYDYDGPLKENWRKGTCVFEMLNEQETCELSEVILNLQKSDSLKQFMIEHDRTSEFGWVTLFACIST